MHPRPADGRCVSVTAGSSKLVRLSVPGPATRRRRSLLGATVLALASVLLPLSRATGQGFSLNEQGTCAMARGGATVAAPCDDGSALFLSPAGIAGATGWTVSAGATLIATSGSFTDDLTGDETDLDNPAIPAPHAYVVYGIDDRLAVGLALATPYGLETNWPLDFPGRFVGYENSIQAFYIQPTAAVQVSDRLAIGVGLDLAIGSVELNRRLDLATQELEVEGLGSFLGGSLGIPRGTDFADVALSADGATGVGGHFGVLLDVTDRLRIGGRYLTRITLDFEGDAIFESVNTGLVLPPNNPIALTLGLDPGTPIPVDLLLDQLDLFAEGAPLADQAVSTRITLPDQLALGVAVRATRDVRLLFDYQWTRWSEFDVIEIEFAEPATPGERLIENFDDTSALRLGLDWTASEHWTVRGGLVRNTAAEPDASVTPLLPEASRNQFTLGAGYRASESVGVDIAYLYLRQDHRRGRVVNPLPGELPSESLNSGLFRFRAHLLALTLSYRF